MNIDSAVYSIVQFSFEKLQRQRSNSPFGQLAKSFNPHHETMVISPNEAWFIFLMTSL